MSSCKICNGQLIFLGKLATVKYFRCRNCAMDLSQCPKIVRDKYDRIISLKY